MQAELVEVAQELFVSQGYESTTVDAIAKAAGMSKRSFFRYFGSKEELVLGKYELMGEQMATALQERPDDEPVWTSLRRMFDQSVEYTSDESHAATMNEMDRIVSSTPALTAGQLGRLDQIQERIAEIVRERAERNGQSWTEADPVPRAIVGAAFACIGAARQSSLRNGAPFASEVDRAMAVMRPQLDG
ncbi:TetR/AcrR family transcriptional regulator [Amnibacterium kyonggiense]